MYEVYHSAIPELGSDESRELTLNERLRIIVTNGRETLAMPCMVQGEGAWKEIDDEDQLRREEYIDEDEEIIGYEPYKCCFGARLAFAFLCPSYRGSYGDVWDYEDGEKFFKAFLRDSGLTDYQTSAVLFVCGAQPVPFGTDPWLLNVSEVLDRLMLVERAPAHDESVNLIREAMDIKLQRHEDPPLMSLEVNAKMMKLANLYYQKLCLPAANGTSVKA